MQYCEYYAENDKCKAWFETNLPSEFAKQARIGKHKCNTQSSFFFTTNNSGYFLGDAGEEAKETEDDKKRQKRGGKGLSKPKKKEGGPKKISLSVAPRGRKRLTVLSGLKSYGMFDFKIKRSTLHNGSLFSCNN